MDAENVKTIPKMTSITQFKGKMDSSRVGQSDEDYSSLEENTFTRKMNDASAHEQKLMKKLEMAFHENEELNNMLKQND